MAAAEYGLMHDAIQRELDAQLRWHQAPWVPMSERAPPGAGAYWVTVERDVQDDGNATRSTRIDTWDGSRWVTAGGYSKIVAWCWMPEAWRG